MQMTPQATRTSSVDAADWSLGEVLWRDTESGIEGRTVIRTPKCTIGSHPDSTICLPEPAALCHATLTFGKRFTLLKAPYPTQIAGRFVREWLIDEPTELNIGSWRIVVVPARSSKSLASVIRPENVFGSLPVGGTPATAVRSAVQQRSPALPSNEADLARETIERLGHIEEQSESRIKAMEDSLETLRRTLESVQANVAQNSDELVARYQAEFQNLSQQWAIEVQQQIQTQLERRDSEWTQSLQSNLSHLENQMLSLGQQMESLSAGVNERLETRPPNIDPRREEDSQRWLESLQQVETRLADISNRVDQLTSTTDDNAQRLTAIASITQENYEYVLGQIQAFQHPTETVWNGGVYLPQETTEPSPSQDVNSWSYEKASVDAPSNTSESGWNDSSYIEPVRVEPERHEESAPAAFGYTNPFEQASFEQASVEPVYQDPLESYQQNESFLPLESYSSVGEPSEPSFPAPDYSAEATFNEEENDPGLNVDDLSERLRRLIADASQPNNSQPNEDAPLFPNSVLAHYDESSQQVDAPEIEQEPGIEQESEYSEWRPSANLDEDSIGRDASANSGFASARLPWNTTSPEDDFASEDSHVSLDADAILAKYGSSGPSEILDDEPAHSEETIMSRPSTGEPASAAQDDNGESVEDESIEAYMQKLLQRVKSGADVGPELPKELTKQSQRSRMEILTGTARETAPTMEPSPVSTTRRMMSPAEFTPRNTAPEKKNDLDALRELANMNARRAISHSDKKRTNSAILFKVSIVSLAIACAAIIFAINGTERNPPFAGMIAALIVAGLWGYDCVQHFLRIGRTPSKSNASPSTAAVSSPSPDVIKD